MTNPVIEKISETWYGVFRSDFAMSRGAPHIRDAMDIKRYMISVIFALTPALVGGVIAFGSRVLLLLLVSYLAGGAVEVAVAVIRRRPIEVGFLVTGMLFALTLPPSLPLWTAALGIGFGTFFGKEFLRGTGRNILNSALVGRLFITISFPTLFAAAYGALPAAPDAISGVTPLAAWYQGTPYEVKELLFAAAPGAFGEVSRLLLILGGLWLILTRIVDWRIPLSYLGGTALFILLIRFIDPSLLPPVGYSLLSGGLILGAFFMASDPVTSPVSRWGKLFYGISCALFTVLFRGFSPSAEGVMFAILLSNALAPLFDKAILALKYPPQSFGAAEPRIRPAADPQSPEPRSPGDAEPQTRKAPKPRSPEALEPRSPEAPKP